MPYKLSYYYLLLLLFQCVYIYFDEFQSYRDVTLLNQDGMNKLLTVTNQLIYEKWIKLTDMCRTQVLIYVDLPIIKIVLSVTSTVNSSFADFYCIHVGL